jgi:large subunit ribosomal protein L24
MKKLWSKFWKSSTQKRKQRKYVHNAPMHVKHKLIGASLSKELKKEHGIRSIPVRKGDTVKIETGNFKGKSGKVTKVSLAKVAIYVENVDVNRADGTKALYPLHPSNVTITKLDLSDKKRVQKIERVNKNK